MIGPEGDERVDLHGIDSANQGPLLIDLAGIAFTQVGAAGNRVSDKDGDDANVQISRPDPSATARIVLVTGQVPWLLVNGEGFQQDRDAMTAAKPG